MSLLDVFNLSFVVYLGILILCVSLLFVYFESKLREQNHKMLHMLEIVTTLSNEVRFSNDAPRPPAIQETKFGGGGSDAAYLLFNTPHPLQMQSSSNLIDVSDGESVEDLDEEYEDEESLDDEESSVAEDEESLDNEELSVAVDEESSVAEDLTLEQGFDAIPEESLEDLSKEEEIKVVKLTDDEDIVFVQQDAEIFDDFSKVLSADQDDNNSISSITSATTPLVVIKQEESKVIHMDDNASVASESNETNLKNMSINKLRRLAQEKGLVQGNIRLKKPELVTLLEKNM